MSLAVTHAVSRFMLWIDGVGGYLVCESPSVAIGQPTTPGRFAAEARRPDDEVHGLIDIPVMADISRRHALVERHGEHYLLRPLRSVLGGNSSPTQPRRLGNGTRFELGERPGRGLQMRFDLPNVCSLTGRLVVESKHRLQPHADGILLLADSCLVGPAEDAHVCIPRLSRTLVIHRRADGRLVFRTAGSYDVDGTRGTDTTSIDRKARIRADDFSLHLEPLAS